MTGDGRLPIVAPLHLFFGARLLVTGALLWTAARGLWATWDPLLGLLALALGHLAALHLSITVGIASRRDSARRLGVGVCITGTAIGVLLCLVAPLAWYLAIVVLAVG